MRNREVARANASPTWSDPEGSSHNESRLGRCSLSPIPFDAHQKGPRAIKAYSHISTLLLRVPHKQRHILLGTFGPVDLVVIANSGLLGTGQSVFGIARCRAGFDHEPQRDHG